MALGWRKGYIRYKSFFLNIYRVYKSRGDLRMFLEIILSLSTISFFAYFALRPTALTITQLLEDIKAKSEVVQQMDEKIENLTSAQTVFQNEAGRLVILNQSLPSTPQPEAFARQIEGLAQRHGVNLGSIVMDDIVLFGQKNTVTTGEVVPLPQGAGEINFSFNVLGAYPSLSSFMNDLENLRRIAKIDHANFSVAETETEKTLTLTISGRVPYYAQ